MHQFSEATIAAYDAQHGGFRTREAAEEVRTALVAEEIEASLEDSGDLWRVYVECGDEYFWPSEATQGGFAQDVADFGELACGCAPH